MKKIFIPLFLILILFQACDRDEPTPSNNEHVNTWIHENMKYWYYWADGIPSDPDKTVAPDAFFESLLNTEDRFSWIQENYSELLNSLRGVNKEGGFEFALYRESEENTNVIMQVLYVKPNSPASAAGMTRGGTIRLINGTQITTENYQDLIGDMSESYSIFFEQNTPELQEPRTIEITPVEYAEDPNYLNKVLDYGDHKIGYYVYNLFAQSADGKSRSYDAEMEDVFASFKSQGITDLVIDLRYNSGGAISSAQNLASLIAPNVNASTAFAKYEYNSRVTTEIKNDPNLGEGFLSVPFFVKTQNVGSMLNGNRVYILTGSRTASSSELIINGLKPFMDVFLIGDVTVGKNMGSISLYDEDDPDNTWGMQPLVVKLLNSNGNSDYSNGFNPQILDEDRSLSKYPLGDPSESLLSKAIEQITGNTMPARTAETKKVGDLLFHSLDAKRRSGIVTVDLPF